MTTEALSGGLSERDLQGALQSVDKRRFWDPRKYLGSRGNSQALVTNGNGIDKIQLKSSSESKELLMGENYILTDLLPSFNPETLFKNPIEIPDIRTTMEWANHSDVKGHIYQLESGPKELYEDPQHRWAAYLEYYRGVKDDEGYDTDPKDITFFKGMHVDDMISVAGMRWHAPRFHQRGRTAYFERLIVNPDLPPRNKVGLATALRSHLFAFYEYDGYTDKLPASQTRTTTYADEIASPWGRNEEFMLMLGYDHHKLPKTVEGRRIQPWIMDLPDFEKAMPKALEHVGKSQPMIASILETEWHRLQEGLPLKNEKFEITGRTNTSDVLDQPAG